MGPKGIIFPEGNIEHWVWRYAKVVEVPEEEQPLFDRFLEMLNDLDDVQNVYTNAE